MQFDKLSRAAALAKPAERRAETAEQALEAFQKNFLRSPPSAGAPLVLDRLAELWKVLAERTQLVAEVYSVGAAIDDIEKRLTYLEAGASRVPRSAPAARGHGD